MIKHTPGPWAISGEINGHPQHIVVGRFNTAICTMQEWDDPRWQHQNALLIAAAPDLLVSLKEMREALAAAFRLIDDHRLNAEFVKSIDDLGIPYGFGVRAQNAVSKAEGTTRHAETEPD